MLYYFNMYTKLYNNDISLSFHFCGVFHSSFSWCAFIGICVTTSLLGSLLSILADLMNVAFKLVKILSLISNLPHIFSGFWGIL